MKNEFGYASKSFKGRYLALDPVTKEIKREFFGTTHLRSAGFNPGGPSNVVLGKQRTYKGYIWVQVPREITDLAAYLAVKLDA